MSHGCERWSKNHTQFIQHAFFNGVGFVRCEPRQKYQLILPIKLLSDSSERLLERCGVC
jgi:hypothetical protein